MVVQNSPEEQGRTSKSVTVSPESCHNQVVQSLENEKGIASKDRVIVEGGVIQVHVRV